MIGLSKGCDCHEMKQSVQHIIHIRRPKDTIPNHKLSETQTSNLLLTRQKHPRYYPLPSATSQIATWTVTATYKMIGRLIQIFSQWNSYVVTRNILSTWLVWCARSCRTHICTWWKMTSSSKLLSTGETNTVHTSGQEVVVLPLQLLPFSSI